VVSATARTRVVRATALTSVVATGEWSGSLVAGSQRINALAMRTLERREVAGAIRCSPALADLRVDKCHFVVDEILATGGGRAVSGRILGGWFALGFALLRFMRVIDFEGIFGPETGL